jgi:hypothetical protein
MKYAHCAGSNIIHCNMDAHNEILQYSINITFGRGNCGKTTVRVTWQRLEVDTSRDNVYRSDLRLSLRHVWRWLSSVWWITVMMEAATFYETSASIVNTDSILTLPIVTHSIIMPISLRFENRILVSTIEGWPRQRIPVYVAWERCVYSCLRFI